LPSNVSLVAAQRFASTLETTPASPVYEGSETYSQVSSPQAASPAARPGLRHTASIASSAAVTERNSRLRSGSLTLPPSGLSSAFGPSLFSTSWLSNARSNTLDELRSSSSLDPGPGEEYNVHTLDYLGLDDGGRPPPPVTVSELRLQAQAAISGSIANPSRHRANTVSNPYRSRAAPGMLSPRTEEDEMNEAYDSQQQNMDYETALAQGGGFFPQMMNNAFKTAPHLASAAARPRAVSVAHLDDAARSSSMRRTDSYDMIASPTTIGPAVPTQPSKLQMGRGVASSPTIRFPNAERQNSYLSSAGPLSGRASSPKTDNSAGQIQTPSRSLWIGNLDSSMTSEALIHVFAPYGAIESLRLLPEKVRYMQYPNFPFLTTSINRNAVSSTLSSRRMPFAPKRTFSTVSAATLACPTAKQCASASERQTVLLLRLPRVGSCPPGALPLLLRLVLDLLLVRLSGSIAQVGEWMPSCSRRLRGHCGLDRSRRRPRLPRF